MTIEEAAIYLRLDVGRDIRDAVLAFDRLVRHHKITPTKGVGRFNRFAREELDRFIREQTSPATPGSPGSNGTDAEENLEP